MVLGPQVKHLVERSAPWEELDADVRRQLEQRLSDFNDWPETAGPPKTEHTWSSLWEVIKKWAERDEGWKVVYSGSGAETKRARIQTPDGASLRDYDVFMRWQRFVSREIAEAVDALQTTTRTEEGEERQRGEESDRDEDEESEEL